MCRVAEHKHSPSIRFASACHTSGFWSSLQRHIGKLSLRKIKTATYSELFSAGANAKTHPATVELLQWFLDRENTYIALPLAWSSTAQRTTQTSLSWVGFVPTDATKTIAMLSLCRGGWEAAVQDGTEFELRTQFKIEQSPRGCCGSLRSANNDLSTT